MKKQELPADGNRLGYLFYGPGGQAQEPLPMLVYLHGTDGCGANPARLLEIESLPQYLESGRIHLKNAALLAPQCPAGSNWAEQAARVMELVKAITAAERIDPARIALTAQALAEWAHFRSASRILPRFPAWFPCAGR